MKNWSLLRPALPHGKDVLLVSPSTTVSELFDNAIETFGPRPFLSPGGRHEIILTPGGKLLACADRLCPPLVNRVAARLGKSGLQAALPVCLLRKLAAAAAVR